MKAEIKQKWLEALRSGQYEQGAGVLRDKFDRFCCLGVLCDLVDPSGWREVKPVDTCIGGHDIEIDAYPYLYVGDAAETTLPYPLQKHAELAQADITALIEMNDAGRDFMAIARHIEANIPVETIS